MPRQLVLLSGPIGSGKTTLATRLVAGFDFIRISTRSLIDSGNENRATLQRGGDSLDRKTKGLWVAEYLAKRLGSEREDVRVIVDSVRIPEQVEGIRKSFGARVVHVHLTAPLSELEHRFLSRKTLASESSTYADVRKNRTERTIERLQSIADIVIDTARATAEDVVARVASQLGLHGAEVQELVDVIVGGQFGSEGKGQLAAYLAPEYEVLVRVGGPNAGHTVFEEPDPFTFHHLPSGTRCSEASIVLGAGATLWVPGLLREIADCKVSVDRLSIDPSAMIIEPMDREFEEKTLKSSIASTAQGVGSATARKILRSAADPKVRLAKEVDELRLRC